MIKCDVRNCEREFKTVQALSMHKYRTHGIFKKKAKKAKKKWTRRHPLIELNHCPQCGMNLRILAQALAAIKGL